MSTETTFKYPCKKVSLYVPTLKEVCDVLQKGLSKHFRHVEVSVERCPNLQLSPFNLARNGLCGNEKIADIGGPPYLVPKPQRDKHYSMKDISIIIDMPDNAFMIGPGAGPFHVVGTNCELMANIAFKSGQSNDVMVTNKTHLAMVDDRDGCCLLKTESSEFGLMANLFACEGNSGDVLKIIAKKRVGSDNFVTAMRKILFEEFGEKTVSLGGVFLIKSGKAKLHVMPDFSKTPLQSEDDVNNWLNFYNISSPLVCLSVFHSYDPGLDLRIEHTHCFSDHGEGGHYHYDTTPEEVHYEGYFNIAKELYRIDAPIVTHNIGRD